MFEMRNLSKAILVFVVSVLMSSNVNAQYYIVKGIVVDSLTLAPLSYISVSLQGTTDGVSTDAKGHFFFKTHHSQAVLKVSSVGYELYKRKIHLPKDNDLEIRIKPASYNLAEVIIKPKREHYKKKNNPAVEFVRGMIAHRDDNSLNNLDYWQRDCYGKTTFAINNFDSVKQRKSEYRRFKFLMSYVDTSAVTGKPILTVSTRELLATDFYRKSPHEEKQWINARRHAGIDEMFSQQGIQAMINEVFKDVDIYENNITLFTNKFVSPLSHLGPSFYKYYLMDTLQINHERCVDLAFVPFNSESFGFTGHLYVTLDSTYFVKRAILNFPKKINLNFVDYMILEQDFKRSDLGCRLLTHENIQTVFKLTDKGDGIYAQYLKDFYNYSFNLSPEAKEAYNRPEKVIEENVALSRPAVYWNEKRPAGVITNNEKSVDVMMKRLRSYPVFYWTEKIFSILFSGYVPIPRDAPLFYYGPVNTTINSNSLEGVRIRAGGMTTAWLDPHLFLKGYVAYGFKDKRVKGLAEIEYSFNKKKEYANEYPIRSLKLRYESEVNQYGQDYIYTSKDNMFLMLKRQRDDRIGYIRNMGLTYTNEFYSGLSVNFTIQRQTLESSSLIPFIRTTGYTNQSIKQFSNTEAQLKVRYAPKEKFYQTQWNRFPISMDAPVFTLTHTVSRKGLLGSSYTYNHTEAGVQKRFWFSAFGYTDVILKAGKVWNKVPFPLLIFPNANLSYTIQPESYSLMNAMEFMNDEYCSWDVTYYLNGWLFNHLPLVKKTKWRSILSSRGLYGHLSNKNNPLLTDGLYQFPDGSFMMNSIPYVEVGVGIENIFKVLRFDYVWRLTYRNLPGIDVSGLRVSLHVTF